MSALRVQLFADGRLVLDRSEGRATIGRGPANDVALDAARVSRRRHGEIAVEEDAVVYRDLGSANGSIVRRGKERLAVDDGVGRARALADGDELLLGPPEGPVELAVRVSGAEARSGLAATRSEDLPLAVLDVGAGAATIVVGVNRIDDVEAISLRVEDDQAALRSLYRLLKGLSGVRDTGALFAALAALVLETFSSATDVAIYLRSATDPDDFVPHLARSRRGAVPLEPPSRTLLARLLAQREAILFRDLEGLGEAVSLVTAKVLSGMVVPLWDEDDVRGFVQVVSRVTAGAFEEKDLDLLTLMGNQAALLLANLSRTEELRAVNHTLTDALDRIVVLNQAKEHLAKFVPETVRKKVESSPVDPGLNPEDVDASVLFLDIGGYTKLTEALERDKIIFLVERYFSAFLDDILAHGGDINETAGDGLMILFQHEDPAVHALNAVGAAVAIRRKTRAINGTLEGLDPIAVNVGIHTGVVSIGAKKMDGLTGSRWTFTATGMVTNVSARIGAYCTNGMICISPATEQRVRGRFLLREHPPVQFKNVSQPMPVFEVLDGLDEAPTLSLPAV